MRWIIILKEHINNYPIKSTNLRDKSPIYKDNTKMNFGQNLMLIRKQKKLSQADLEKIIGTSGDVIGRYKRGDITPSVDVVAIIADALEVSVDYLIGKTKLVIELMERRLSKSSKKHKVSKSSEYA